MQKLFWAGILALAIIGGLVFFTSRGSNEAQTIDTTQTATEATVTTSGRILEVPVALTTQFFEPHAFSVSEGDTVTLVITAADRDHTVFFANTAESKTLAQGETARFTFTAKYKQDVSVRCTSGCDQDVALAITVA